MGWKVGASSGSAVGELIFASPQALAAFDASAVNSGAIASVGVINDEFRLIKAAPAGLVAAADGLNVIAPAAPAGAVWERQYIPNVQAWYQTAWEIDPVGGDDRNLGDAAHPLKTIGEFCNRLRNGVIKQDVTVTCLAGTISGPVRLKVTLDYASNTLLRIVGSKTSSAPAQVSAVTAAVPTSVAGTNVRGHMTSATPFADKARIRFTDGARAGYVCYVTGLNGVNTDAFFSKPGILANLHPSASITPTTGNPAANDHFVVDTLSTVLDCRDMHVEVLGSGRLVFEDFQLQSSGNLQVCRGGNPGNFASSVLFYNCEQINAGEFIWFSDSQVAAVNCAWNGFLAAANNSVLFLRTCVFRLVSGTGQSLQVVEGGYVQLASSNCFDGGSFNADIGTLEINGGDLEFCDGQGTGMQFLGRCYVHNGALVWGGSAAHANAFAQFLRVYGSGGSYGTTGTFPCVGPNSASDCLLGNITKNYTALPYFHAGLGCGITGITS